MQIAVFMSGLLIAALVVFVLERRGRRAFEQRFPPISDADFLARCRSGTNPAIALKVRRIVSNQLGIQYERIYPSSSFVEDLGC